MAALASSLGDAAQAAAWEAVRAELLVGLATSLSYSSANETGGSPIYAELIGSVHYWWPGSGNAYPPGNSTGPLDSLYVRGRFAACREAAEFLPAPATTLPPPSPRASSSRRACLL